MVKNKLLGCNRWLSWWVCAADPWQTWDVKWKASNPSTELGWADPRSPFTSQQSIIYKLQIQWLDLVLQTEVESNQRRLLQLTLGLSMWGHKNPWAHIWISTHIPTSFPIDSLKTCLDIHLWISEDWVNQKRNPRLMWMQRHVDYYRILDFPSEIANSLPNTIKIRQ